MQHTHVVFADEVSSYQWHSWFTKEEKGRCFRWWKAEENDQVSSFITDGLHLSSCSSSSSFHKAARTDASSSRTSKMENARQGRSEVDDFYRSSGGASSRCSYRGVSDCSNTANSSSRYPSRLGSGSAALSAQAAVVDIGKSTHFLCGPKQHREIISIQNARQPGGAPRRDDHWRELSLHILRLKRAAEARCRGYLHPVFPKWHTAQQRKRELSSLRPTIPDEERLANDTKAAVRSYLVTVVLVFVSVRCQDFHDLRLSFFFGKRKLFSCLTAVLSIHRRRSLTRRCSFLACSRGPMAATLCTSSEASTTGRRKRRFVWSEVATNSRQSKSYLVVFITTSLLVLIQSSF